MRFLSRVPPFKGLPAEELDRVAASIRERAVAAGEAILVEGGPPGTELYVVRLGALELIHKDAYVAVVTAGEVVGHPTLLTGLAPEFTTRPSLGSCRRPSTPSAPTCSLRRRASR